MALQKAMVSSKTAEYITPQALFDLLHKEFRFTLDPCATKQNAKCKKFFTKKDDGLSRDWGKEVVFMNPPYVRQTRKWVEKAYKESTQGATCVCLLPVGTGRSYWHDIIFPHAAQIRWIRGFLKFSDHTMTAPFASAIVIFDRRREYHRAHIWNYFYTPKVRKTET